MNNKKMSLLFFFCFNAAAASLLLTTQGALAQKKYNTGVSDTEIKIGNLAVYSEPASAYALSAKPRPLISR